MKAQCLGSDRISSLPQNIIENILCLVPIQDAVRTSILSRNWRYNWVTIPKLVFNGKDMFKKSTEEDQLSILEQTFEERPSERKHLKKRCKVFYAIFQVLLQHEGPIHEFTLSMNANDTSVEIDQIIRYLSKKNTLKKLAIHLKYVFRYTVPLYVFSMPGLTHLDLRDCNIGYRLSFDVIGSLTSLYMYNVNTCAGTLLNLLSKSPLLKSLTLFIYPDCIYNYRKSTIAQLYKCLPVIEHFSVSMFLIKCFAEDGLSRELPSLLIHLKYFYLDDMCFMDEYGLPFLFLLIRSSPNVGKIKLEVLADLSDMYSQSEIDSVTLDAYSDIWLEHLNEFVFSNFGNLKPELELLKLILAKSPVLKKVKISLNNEVSNDEELEMLKTLLCSSRASSVVKIFVIRRV